jgi:hypothetical protein
MHDDAAAGKIGNDFVLMALLCEGDGAGTKARAR